MAELIIENKELMVRLTRLEKIATLRGDLRIPLVSVRGAEVFESGLQSVRGVRWWAGLFWPGVNAVGTFHYQGKKTFAVIHHGMPRAVRLTLAGAQWDGLIVGSEDPEAVAASIGSLVHAMSKATSDLVSFQSEGLAIAGAFVDSPTPTAAALILSGSGKCDRDGNVPKLALGVSWAIAQALKTSHIATLRYDKRGVGASEGDFLTTGFGDNYADARSALAWLSSRCPNLAIFVIGHSEGALHAAHLAADEKVAGAVLLACPARVGEEILTWQARAIVATLPKRTTTLLKLIHVDPLKSQRKQFARIRSTAADVIRVQGKKLNARWLRQFLDYDPVPVFQRIAVPILAMAGGHDLQVPPADAEAIARLVPGPGDARIIGDLSHALRSDPDSLGPRDYRRAVHQPVSSEVLTLITTWIVDHSARQA